MFTASNNRAGLRAGPDPAGRGTMNGLNMRRVLALLLAICVIAATATASPVVCASPFAPTASIHGCCGDQLPLLTAPPSSCCAISQAPAPRGPIQSRVVSTDLQFTAVAALWLRRADPPERTLASLRPPDAAVSPVPLYLQQLSLLI